MRFLVTWIGAALLTAAGPAHAAWYEAKSKHFIIYANQDPDKLRSYADRLERFDHAVRFVRGMDDPPLTDSNRLQVYVLPSEGAVAKLIGYDAARGLYESRASGSFAFVPRSAGSVDNQWDLHADQIFFHEYAHHLQLQYASLAIPTWVVEGFAEFFATAEVGKDGKVVIGNYPPYRIFGLYDDAGLTLEQMVGSTYKKLNDAQVNALYGRGWLLMHYLTFSEGRKGQLEKYLNGIQDGLSASESAKSAFGDLKQLDRDLSKYMRQPLKGIVLKPEQVTSGSIELRPLSAGEAAIMPVRIRSKRGVDEKSAPAVASDARKAAAPYPTDSFVQASLAEAEYDAKNYSAADAAADRALAVDPTNVHALIYKGRARLALAKASGQVADLDKVRSWFVKANKIDTENAEPLALFYLTYTESGQSPTKNSVEGLLYAVQLAPRDDELRMTAVRELLRENRPTEAKAAFAPFAYQPHATAAFRDALTTIMSAISAGDAKGALKLIETGPEKKPPDGAGH